jgi:hypothetical protein
MTRKPIRSQSDVARVQTAYSQDILGEVCSLPERSFAGRFGLARRRVRAPGVRAPHNYYFHADRGASVLAVAHLDTVAPENQRKARFVDTAAGPVVHSRALDDRLGAYVILDMLPKLGIMTDVLLTTGEESGMSTAAWFEPPRAYDWLIEFDRGGTDVVLYQYEDAATCALVEATGAKIGMGSYSDIADLEHLECKAMNWGVGYRDYHGPRAHAYLSDTFESVARYVRFHDDNAGTFLPHYPGKAYEWPEDASVWFGDGSDAVLTVELEDLEDIDSEDYARHQRLQNEWLDKLARGERSWGLGY